jgi:hypothetical protein
MSFEEAKDGCCAVTIAIPMPLEETMNDGTYSYVAPQDVEDIVHQYPCENESHIAKLSESENKSELCDSTKCKNESHIAKLSDSENKSEMCDSTQCEVESINKWSVRDTPHKKIELHCKTCEGDLNTKPLISTSSVVSQNMQVRKKKEEEIAAHNTAIHDKRSKKVVIVDNQFIDAPSLNHHNEGGRNRERASSLVVTAPQ